MPIEIKIPQVGESVSEVRIGRWLKQPGDSVRRDDDLVELETDKAAVMIPSPADGVLGKIVKSDGSAAAIGETVGVIQEKIAKRPQGQNGPPPEPASAARRGVRKHELAPPPQPASAAREQSEPRAEAPQRPEPQPEPRQQKEVENLEDEEVVPMSPLRLAIAERLVTAQRQAALLTTFNEIDLTAVQTARRQFGEEFQDRHGVRLGLMSFFVLACVEALKSFPQINSEVRGRSIVLKRRIDIGIAVGTGKGLVVPVIRNADRLGPAEIERAVEELSARASANKLAPGDLEGGTFTITNGGIYGSLLSTPIVNPPQSAIFGMHAIVDRPVAREGRVEVRPMMYAALTYDHRVIDGREAVQFLRRIKEAIESPVRGLLRI